MAILWILFVFAVVTGPLIAAIVIGVCRARRIEKEQMEMFHRAADLTEKKLDKEAQEALPKRIVKCEYCGKSVRFGNGSCPNCGARLNAQHGEK